ncbi:MAG TPA: hypothetical protein VGO00_25475 [Kofleriaceae bacterium]|nr:hypothetical protein [Kofleriaceae bacterium]
MIARGALVLAMVGCHEPARVTVVAAADSCGLPKSSDLQGIKLHAYAPSGEVIDSISSTSGAVDLSDLPADTVQLGIEGFGVNSGTLLEGKSSPLVFDDLANGQTISIFMAPPDGTCPTGMMADARQAPLVARAGDGAVVVGGIGPSGPVATAEYFDPASGTFAPVDVPPELIEANGLAGFVLTTMPDGRVVMTGGARYLSIFDPAKSPLAFTSPQVFAAEQRAFHAAIALDADHLLLAGGCTDVSSGACAGLFLTNTRIYALDDLGHPVLGPMLSTGSEHASPQLFELGIQTDGQTAYVLAGGDIVPGLGGTPLVGERFEVDDAASTMLAIQAQPAALDGGAVLTAFAPDGSSPSGAVAVVVPDGEIASMSNGPPQGKSRLVALEDGTVAGLGGDANGAVHIYVPTTDSWKTVAAGGPTLSAPSLLRLADGSVLAIDGGASTTQAWRYRPSLIGASSGTVSASFPTMGTQDTVLVAPDPRPITHAVAYEITAIDDTLSARALVGGPRMAAGSVQVSGRVDGGIALIGQQLGPGRALVAHLVAGQPSRIDRIHDGTVTTLCSGEMPAFPGGNVAVDVALTVSGQSATVSLAHQTLASCALDSLGNDAGAWGMAPDGATAKITVFTVTATRNTQQQ